MLYLVGNRVEQGQINSNQLAHKVVKKTCHNFPEEFFLSDLKSKVQRVSIHRYIKQKAAHLKKLGKKANIW